MGWTRTEGTTMVYKKLLLLILLCVLKVECELNLPEGSACNIKGVNGTCVTLYKCNSAALDTIFTRSGYDLGPGMPEEVCSYTTEDNEPIYCCTDCTLDANESLSNSVVLPEAAIVERKKSIAWNKCADYFQTLPYRCRGKTRYGVTYYKKYYNETANCQDIRSTTFAFGGGGRDARRGEFPHMALLGFGADQKSAQWLCGGTVISEQFILTAAHCISSPALGNLTYAALGILKRTDPEELWKVYKIKRIIVHPQYQSPHKYHDIALLETETEINFGRNLLPACLDTPVSDTYTYLAKAPGWGRLGHKKQLAETLQILKQFNESSCDAIFPPHRHLQHGYNHTMQMCYGATTETAITDTCEGDSGGPLQSDYDCIYTVFGVTSFGKDCGVPGSAGMYTRVKYYVPWIESVVWPELYQDYYN